MDGAADEALLHQARTAFDFGPSARVGVAASGGGDSMALLHLFARLVATDELQVEAVTVDHGLRPEAVDEAKLVGQFCAEHGILHHVLQWAGQDHTGNLMAAARDARYKLIADWAVSRGISGIALGHTKDDLAENFLIRLARKAGPDGLAAMDTHFLRHGLVWARPLWQRSRADLRGYLRRHDLKWVEDPTNDDDRFERTRARQALTVLEDFGVTKDVLASVSGTMRRSSDALRHYAQIEARRYIVQDEGDLVLRLGLTGPLPEEIKRRLWLAAIPWINQASYPPRHKALFQVLSDVADGDVVTVGGCLITRKSDDWRVTREYQAVRDLSTPTDQIWDGRWQLEGPHAPYLQIRALGDGVRGCPDWRATGFPRASLIATPAVWQEDTLIAAPLAGLSNGWRAQIVADFHQSAFAH